MRDWDKEKDELYKEECKNIMLERPWKESLM